MTPAGIAHLTFGLILSLSKDEAAVRPVDASSFDKLRMRRLLMFALGLTPPYARRPITSSTGARRPCTHCASTP